MAGYCFFVIFLLFCLTNLRFTDRIYRQIKNVKNMFENRKMSFWIRKNMGAIVLVGLLVASFSFLVLVISQKKFKAGTDFLIVQNQTESQDFYSLSKSAEYIRDVLSESVYSELFINEVINTGKVNSEFLPFNKKERIKKWGKIVKVKGSLQPGIIRVEVLEDSQKNVIDISEAVIEVMVNKNQLFRGEGNVQIKVLSGPIIEKNPSLSEILMVVIGGFGLGFLLGLIGIYYKEEKEAAFYHGFDGENKDEEYKESLEYLER